MESVMKYTYIVKSVVFLVTIMFVTGCGEIDTVGSLPEAADTLHASWVFPVEKSPVAISPDGSMVAGYSVGRNSHMMVLDAFTGDTLSVHERRIEAFIFDEQSKNIVCLEYSREYEYYLNVRNARTGNVVFQTAGPRATLLRKGFVDTLHNTLARATMCHFDSDQRVLTIGVEGNDSWSSNRYTGFLKVDIARQRFIVIRNKWRPYALPDPRLTFTTTLDRRYFFTNSTSYVDLSSGEVVSQTVPLRFYGLDFYSSLTSDASLTYDRGVVRVRNGSKVDRSMYEGRLRTDASYSPVEIPTIRGTVHPERADVFLALVMGKSVTGTDPRVLILVQENGRRLFVNTGVTFVEPVLLWPKATPGNAIVLSGNAVSGVRVP